MKNQIPMNAMPPIKTPKLIFKSYVLVCLSRKIRGFIGRECKIGQNENMQEHKWIFRATSKLLGMHRDAQHCSLNLSCTNVFLSGKYIFSPSGKYIQFFSPFMHLNFKGWITLRGGFLRKNHFIILYDLEIFLHLNVLPYGGNWEMSN